MKKMINKLAQWVVVKTASKELTNFEKYVARITRDHEAWERR